MPSLANSLAKARVTDSKPPFVRLARLAGRHATGWLTSEVVTATTWPDCCRRICAMASCETEKNPTRFVPIAWLRSCAVSSLNGLGRKTPALYLLSLLFCPPVTSRNIVLLQSLPNSISYRQDNVRRRKDAPRVGPAAKRSLERLSRLPRRLHADSGSS